MAFLYYKCNICNFVGRYGPFGSNEAPNVICPTCNSQIKYSKAAEEAWINELDANGNRLRVYFKGSDAKDCVNKAITHFQCQKEDIDYDIVKPQGVFSSAVILAWKPVFDITPNMKKIIAHPGWIKGWIAIDPVNKIIISPGDNNGKQIKYDKIESINYYDSSGSICCTLILHPYMKIGVNFVPDTAENVDMLIDTLYDDLPQSENEMYITCFFKKDNIPIKRKYCHVAINNINLNLGDSSFIWRDKDFLCICNTVIKNGIKIKISNIKYYRIVGDKYITTQVTGGGGGGSSIKGAIIGGIIAGDAGAVIGSRQAVESVRSSSYIHDEKNVLMYSNNLSIILKFNSKIYDILLDLLPEKEYEYTIHEVKESFPSNTCNTTDTKSKLKELKSMFEEDLITEEEYNNKKQELLSKM